MSDSIESMSIQEVRESLTDLVRLVAQGKKRIEIRSADAEPCLLICKTEVDALEKALSILGDTAEVQALSTSFVALAATVNQPVLA